jgi:hypothetical protein
MKRWISGWRLFFELVAHQRRKKHGAGKQPWLLSIYNAGCGRGVTLRPQIVPWEARLAQFLATGDTTEMYRRRQHR